jgi:glycosyltransferase involved in cell wall biosynthesis
MQTFAAVFTVFGPLYVWKLAGVNITGFAQAWIIYPDNECYAMLPFMQRIKTRLKYWVQGLFYKRADVLVVELEHVKQRLMRVLGIPGERIHVLHNCISSIYLDVSVWQPLDVPKAQGFLRLGFLGRNYMHKNTVIFPAIAAALAQQHGLEARFYVTFTDQEWAACTPEFRAVCINVGPLSVAQCPHFYLALDAVVFPSLLECFSATPLEAMAMQKPLFASDRPFNRDICGDHAHYFDPLDPVSAAAAIASVFVGPGPDASALQAARAHAIHFSSPKERAEKYLTLLTNCVLSEDAARP